MDMEKYAELEHENRILFMRIAELTDRLSAANAKVKDLEGMISTVKMAIGNV